MKKLKPLPSELQIDFHREFESISRRVMRCSRDIVARSLSAREKRLNDIVTVYLPQDGTSEYAYMFALCHGGLVRKEMRAIENLAAAINLLQASTFVIDDVLDESRTRYDEPTLWSEHGTGVAVACGHVLESIAVEAFISETHKRFPSQAAFVVEIANRIIKDVYRGQILDVMLSKSRRVSRSDYLRMIGFTTGNFFSHVAALGSCLGGRSPRQTRALQRFAYCYGMALQITDDVVDLETNKIFTGKDHAVDLQNRRPRLPMILGLKMAEEENLNVLRTFLESEECDHDFQRVIKILRNCGAIKSCVDLARNYVRRGRAATSSLPGDGLQQRAELMLENLLSAQLLE